MSAVFRRSTPGLLPCVRPSLSPHQVSIPRPIHPHGRRQLHLLADPVQLFASTMVWINSAGVPWYMTMPLFAVIINTTFRLPLQYYTRRVALRRAELKPLMAAWATVQSRALGSFNPGAVENLKLARQQWFFKQSGKTRSRIQKKWGVQSWKSFLNLASFVPFIFATEGARQLAGAPSGAIFRSLSGEGTAAAMDLSQPSLSQGGCLWFVDMAAADPYFILPVLASATMGYTMMHRLDVPRLRQLLFLDKSNIPRFGLFIGRVGLASTLLPLMFYDMPSAVFVFLISSISLGHFSSLGLKKVLPDNVPSPLVVPKEPKKLTFVLEPPSKPSKGER
ncbi:hypothetical protein B0I35DRAFT_478500 [Stachybotrys elegans]|uniref:Uncharacterized protein n=1 Tax=Stachybotrys elegans TaxID=80388 RepID=A0A8K0WRK3_9HYPO|nr:hypothetical protein B0I35DRAFT_478500 [Stachybotrys elegans]